MGNERPASPPGHVDLRALLGVGPSAADILIGVALVMTLFFSFSDAWFHVEYGLGASATLGSMWSGAGYIAGVLLLAAIGFWVVSTFFETKVRIPEMPLSVAHSWMLFGTAEAALIGLYFVAERSSSTFGRGAGDPFSLEISNRVTPGWGWYCCLVSALLVAYGGHLKGRERGRSGERAEPQATANVASPQDHYTAPSTADPLAPVRWRSTPPPERDPPRGFVPMTPPPPAAVPPDPRTEPPPPADTHAPR